jgi:MoaA/NifB/PqqE/SkfB family radical SAM enzyme
MHDLPTASSAASDLKWLLKWYAGFQLKVLLRRPFTPPTLNFLVTLRCDMRCRHCFLWEKLEDPREARELTLEEIEKMAGTMDPLFSLVLSGGEPFLRRDLARIAGIFYERNRVKTLTVLTGGQMTERILEVTREILRQCPEILVAVGVSLDGVGSLHDEIRQKPGAFDRAVRTVRLLKELSATEPRVSVQSCTCLSGLNQDRIFDLYAYLRDDLRPDRIAVNLVRQDFLDPAAGEVNPAVYERLVRLIREDTCSGRLRNRFGFDRFALTTAADLCMTRMILDTLRESCPQIRCRAGSVSAVVFPDGTVHACEMKPAWGNLRETGFHFFRFWSARRKIAAAGGDLPGTGCFCTHEIDCFLPSLPFDVRHYPRLACQWFRVVRGQRRIQDRPGRFAVVVASPAGWEPAGPLLQSLARQTYRDFEVVMVTGGRESVATDDRAETARKGLPALTLVRASECDFAEARNRGAGATGARDLVFLDPDAGPVSPEFLQDLALRMRKEGLVLAVTRRRAPSRGLGGRLLGLLARLRLLRVFQRLVPVRPADGIAVMREIFEAAGGFRTGEKNPEAALIRKGAGTGRFALLLLP